MGASEARLTFGGRTVRRRRVGAFTLEEAQYAPHLSVPEHEHTGAYLGFVLDGACRERTRRRCVDYTPLSLVVKTAGERHSNEAGPRGTRYLLLEVGSERRVPGVFDDHRQLRGSVLAALALRLRDELHAGDASAELAIEGLALELLAELARERRDDAADDAPLWLRRARERLHDGFRDPLSLAELAADVGVHPAHLARGFRRRLGVTPGAYLRRLRVEHSLHLLGSTRRPVATIAVDAGFCDQSHLTRAVRRATGLTPAAWRRAASRDG